MWESGLKKAAPGLQAGHRLQGGECVWLQLTRTDWDDALGSCWSSVIRHYSDRTYWLCVVWLGFIFPPCFPSTCSRSLCCEAENTSKRKGFRRQIWVLFLLFGVATESLPPSACLELIWHLICPGSPKGCQEPPWSKRVAWKLWKSQHLKLQMYGKYLSSNLMPTTSIYI